MQPRWRGNRGLPRSRGDGPLSVATVVVLSVVAPLARGWTLPWLQAGQRSLGCPARAGMDPHPGPDCRWLGRLPRSRGDGPQPIPPTPGAPEVAPLARGWTPPMRAPTVMLGGCPARAGMDPCSGCRCGRPIGLPRSRGDGPSRASLTVSLMPVAPLARGWTPGLMAQVTVIAGCPARAGMDPCRTG